MKRFFAFVLLVSLCVLASVVDTKALSVSADISSYNLTIVDAPAPTIILSSNQPVPIEPVEPPKPPEKVAYLVVDGDNLSKIGSLYNVEWQRLWAKNTELKHPDLIYVGDEITIPEPSEQLSREIPAVVALPAETPGVAPLRDFGGGNTYDFGYCTWYVKNRRGASIPNTLGNANTWQSRAAAAGMAVGNEPRAGAVGTTTRGLEGHVVYVESVNADGTINISEMNYKGWGKESSRTTKASEFVYIY